MRQSLDYRLTGERLEVAARLAQADAANAHATDLELLADKRIQRNAACDEIAAAFAGSELETVLALRGFHRLGFDQREFEIRFRLKESSLFEEVTISL